ncbi:MAG TPA: hypothetical protein VMX58_04715 [Patescibacteria group bacterium]|nr:hypothetical protein [Patescibacteria group bacterium]
MNRYITYALIISLLAMCQAGCIFDPREAEDPAGEDDTCWIPPNAPTDVFSNLDCGLGSAGNSSYERSLDPDFVFIPRPGYDGPGNFEEWDFTQEMDFVTKLKGDYQGERSIRFGDAEGRFERWDVATSDATYWGEYRITLDSGTGTDPDIFAGKAEFHIVRGTKGWVIKKWEDYDVVDSFPTSANIRGSYQQ